MLMSKASQHFMRNGINYSACNEDTRTEFNFFKIKDNDNVLCLMGGGERFFNLLADTSTQFKASVIDANINQKYLFELKKAAFQKFDYKNFCKFIGLDTSCSSRDRVKLYNQLKKSLSQNTINYWNSNYKWIKKGVLYCGNFERFLAFISKIFQLFFRNEIKTMYNSSSLEEQKYNYTKCFSSIKWKLFLNLLCRKIWFKILLNDPCFCVNVGVGSYPMFFESVFKRAFTEIPIKDNFLLRLMLFGKYDLKRQILPECYKRINYQKVVDGLNRVKMNIVISDVNSFLKDTREAFDCFSLSDVCSYLKEEEIKCLLNYIVEKSNVDARIAIRELMTRFDMDKILSRSLANKTIFRDPKKEMLAYSKDSSFIWNYYFYVKGVKNDS